MEVLEFSKIDSNVLQNFFLKCEKLGFVNNVSLKSIKYDWAINLRMGQFWGVFQNDEMIGMSGCHWMPEIHNNAFRILFRGCELPGTDIKKTLSRSQFNSFNFREVIPYQLKWIQGKGLHYSHYISTNHSNTNNRAMELIAKQGFLTKESEGIYFGTTQTIWKFNTEHYLKIRSNIKTYTQG